MRHTLLAAAAAVVLTVLSGCCAPKCGTCKPAAPCAGHGNRMAAAGEQQAMANAAPRTVAYPYYTTRGPRDFLDRNPQSIGP